MDTCSIDFPNGRMCPMRYRTLVQVFGTSCFWDSHRLTLCRITLMMSATEWRTGSLWRNGSWELTQLLAMFVNAEGSTVAWTLNQPKARNARMSVHWFSRFSGPWLYGRLVWRLSIEGFNLTSHGKYRFAGPLV